MRGLWASEAQLGRKRLAEELEANALGRNGSCARIGLRTLSVTLDTPSCLREDWADDKVKPLRRLGEDSAAEQTLTLCAPMACVPSRQRGSWGWGQLLALHLGWQVQDATELEETLGREWRLVGEWDCETTVPEAGCATVVQTVDLSPDPGVSDDAQSTDALFCCDDGSADCAPEKRFEWNWFLHQAARVSSGNFANDSEIPSVFAYSDRPEFGNCPVARLVLKLYHISWAFSMFHKDLETKLEWALLEGVFNQFQRLRWADLVRTGWGIPIFSFLHEMSVAFCGYARRDTVEHDSCEWEPGLPQPDGKGAMLQFHEDNGGSSMYKQIRFTLLNLLDPQWHIRRGEGSLDSPVRAPFMVLVLEVYLTGAHHREGCIKHGVLDSVQRLYRWYGSRASLPEALTEGVKRTRASMTKGERGERLLHNLGDMVRSAHLMWAVLNFQSLCSALSAGDTEIMGSGIDFAVVGHEKVYTGLFQLWNLTPSADHQCPSCEEKHQWVRGGTSARARKMRALEPCENSLSLSSIVPVNSEFGLTARVIGVALAEVPGEAHQLEWMIDFYDLEDIQARILHPRLDEFPDVCGYRWELNVASFICIFGDGIGSYASVVAPSGPGSMHPGPPLFLSCAVPEGATFPLHVQLRSTDSFWEQPLGFTLCLWQGKEVPLAICTRSWYDLGSDRRHLIDWLSYYERLGVDKVFLYDVDGSAREALKEQRPGFVEYFPNFHTRGRAEWFERLEQQGRWNWNHTRWFPKMGCSVAQSNHCILHARGRAKYILMARALDKFFVSRWTDRRLERFLSAVEDAANRTLPQALAAVAVETYDYWAPTACVPNCQEAHRMKADHGVPAVKDRFLHLVNPAQVYGQGSHAMWMREGAALAELPKGEFWMAHYLRAFDETAESQAREPEKRWRFPLCKEGRIEGKGCAVLRPDDFAALTYKELTKPAAPAGPSRQEPQHRGCSEATWQQLKHSLVLILVAHMESPVKAVRVAPPWFGFAHVHSAAWAECPDAQAAYRLVLVLVYYPPAALEDWSFVQEARLLTDLGGSSLTTGNGFHRILLWSVSRLAQLLCNETLLTKALVEVEGEILPPRTLDRPLDLPPCGTQPVPKGAGSLSRLLRQGPQHWETAFAASSMSVEEQVTWQKERPQSLYKICQESANDTFCALTSQAPGHREPAGATATRWSLLDARGYYVAVSEGANVGSGASLSQAECAAFCEATDDCQSFAHCPDDFGRCWLYDKAQAAGTEAKHHGYCSTYYRAEDSNETGAAKGLPEDWMAPAQGNVLVGWKLCAIQRVQVSDEVAVVVLGASVRNVAEVPVLEVPLFFENQRTWRANGSRQTLGCARCFETAPGANFFRLACNGTAANVTGALGGPRPWSATTVACAVQWADLASGSFEVHLSEQSGAWHGRLIVQICQELAPQPHDLAICTQPLFSLQQHPEVLSDWLSYHRDVLGAGAIDIYDVDGSAAVEGEVSVTYFRRFQELMGSPWLEQATRLSNSYCTEPLQEVHCLYRHRSLGTRRVLFLHSPDEFLFSEEYKHQALNALRWGMPGSLWDMTGWLQLSARNFGGPQGDGPAVARFVHFDPISSDQASHVPLVNPANTLSVSTHWARARNADLHWWMVDAPTLRVNHYLDLFAPRSARGAERFFAEDRSAAWAAPYLRAASEASRRARVAAAVAAWAGRDPSPEAVAAHVRSRQDALGEAFAFLASDGQRLDSAPFRKAFDLALHDHQQGEDLVLFMRILHAYGIRLESAQKALETFKALDQDGSGDLERAEFVDGLDALAVDAERQALLRALSA